MKKNQDDHLVYKHNGYKVVNNMWKLSPYINYLNSNCITLQEITTPKQEQYNNIREKGRYNKFERKYRGNIKKGRNDLLFAVGTLVPKYDNTPYNEFFGFSTIAPPQNS